MMRLKTLIAAVLVVAIVPAAQAQEKYTVKIKEPAVGAPMHIDCRITDKLTQKTTSEKDKETKTQESAGTLHLIFTETILEKPVGAASATKAKHVYEKAVDEGTSEFGGKRPGELAYHGKTVLIEKKDAAPYEFRIEGGKVLDNTEASKLLDVFHETSMRAMVKKFIVPPIPLAPNESWKFDPKKLIDDKEDKKTDTVVKSDGIGTLTKAYRKGDRLYGMVDVAVELQLKPPVSDKANDNAVVTINWKITFDGCIDGTFAEGLATTTMTMHVTNIYRVEGDGAVTTTVNGEARTRETWLELPKK